MRSQYRCWLGLQLPEGLTETGGLCPKVAHSCGSWLEASVAQKAGLTIELLTAREITSPRVSDSRENEEGVNHCAFYNPVPKITHRHFCFILFRRSES